MLNRIQLLFLSLLFINCNSNTAEKARSSENFDSFYEKFHRDSIFQLSRIKFPIEGKKIQEFKKEGWSSKNWEVLRSKISDVDTTKFKVSAIKTDSTFIEKCYIPNSGFYTEYRFKLIDGKWNLVYALDQNI